MFIPIYTMAEFLAVKTYTVTLGFSNIISKNCLRTKSSLTIKLNENTFNLFPTDTLLPVFICFKK